MLVKRNIQQQLIMLKNLWVIQNIITIKTNIA